MDQAIKQEWVEALRQAKYSQGTEYLHEGNNFCVMGVLCDLYIQHNPGKFWWEAWVKTEEGGQRYVMRTDSGQIQAQIAPPQVAQWAGLKSSIGDMDPGFAEEIIQIVLEGDERLDEEEIAVLAYQGELTLTNLNDKGLTFPTLARIIEVTL